MKMTYLSHSRIHLKFFEVFNNAQCKHSWSFQHYNVFLYISFFKFTSLNKTLFRWFNSMDCNVSEEILICYLVFDLVKGLQIVLVIPSTWTNREVKCDERKHYLCRTLVSPIRNWNYVMDKRSKLIEERNIDKLSCASFYRCDLDAKIFFLLISN